MTNISKITLSQWAIFNAVIDHGGYLKASIKLNRSHSSLHHAVAKLQGQLDVKLIEIQGKTPRLTDIGQVLYRRSQQLLKDAADLEQLASTLQNGWESEITIGVENIFPKSILQPALKQFYCSNSISRLKILDVVLMGAVEMIETASADIVISPIVPAGHLGTPLMTLELLPIANEKHALLRTGQPATQRDLAGSLQIVIKDTARLTQKRALGWLRSERRWTVSDFYHAREILKSGDGFCWAPVHFFEQELIDKKFQIIPTVGDLARVVTLYLVLPKPDAVGRGAQLLAQLIREEVTSEHFPL